VVVTRHWDEDVKNETDYIRPSSLQSTVSEHTELGSVIRAPFQPNLRDRLILAFGMQKLAFLRKAITFLLQILRYHIPQLDPTYSIYKAANRYLAANNVDLIIATGEPFILFTHAKKLSKKYNTPWIADYRDCWSNAPHVANMAGVEKWLHETYFRKIEQKTVQNSSFITTAAPSYAEKLHQLHHPKKIHSILNGFFPTPIKKHPEKEEKFTISYAGIFYAHQKLETFLEGFNQLVKKYPKAACELRFYGLNFYPEMVERVKKACQPEALQRISFTNRIPYDDLQMRLRASHLLLLLSAKHANWLNAKIFDYLQANRKILLVENDQGILEEIMDECQAGVTADTPEQVAAILEKHYQEWLETGEVAHQTVNYEKYSRENQTKLLAKLLDNVMDDHHSITTHQHRQPTTTDC